MVPQRIAGDMRTRSVALAASGATRAAAARQRYGVAGGAEPEAVAAAGAGLDAAATGELRSARHEGGLINATAVMAAAIASRLAPRGLMRRDAATAVPVRSTVPAPKKPAVHQ
jgi:hypothetical protein